MTPCERANGQAPELWVPSFAPNLRVVFDTNAYRSLSPATFERLLARSTQHGIIGLASFWVAQELLARMATQSDPDFFRAWSAIRKLVRHCAQHDSGGSNVMFIADSESTTSQLLFGRSILDAYDNAPDYGTLLGTIADAETPSVWSDYQWALDAIRESVEAAERSFIEHMWQSIILPLSPNATAWDALSRSRIWRQRLRAEFESTAALHLAGAHLVDGMAQRSGVALDAAQRAATIAHALELFPTPIHFLRTVARKVAVDGYKLSAGKNANSLWDMNVAYSTSAHGEIDGRPIWVISGDASLLTAAREARSGHVFRHHEEFLSLIERPTQDVIAEIRRRRPEGAGHLD